VWLLVFAFSALPVYFFYNMDATCHTIEVLTETPASINQLCVDARQYGKKKGSPNSLNPQMPSLTSGKEKNHH
jgi:hypothetical protein